jgi:8-oxo-dGTP pyrophosphatase MutT (NUDIX family)
MTAIEPATVKNGAPRTLLEQRIRDRRLTFEEFVAFVEKFARENGEDGTLSLRHLQRLVTGTTAASRLRPATARLLERILDENIQELLTPAMVPQHGPYELRVAIAVVVWDTRVLVVQRRDDSGPVWQFPAGMVKPTARSDAVAAAETLAETGVLCEPTRLVGSRVHPRTNVHCDYHLCRYVAGEARNLDPAENLGVLWVERAKVTALIPRDDIYLPVLDELIPVGSLNR